MNKANDIAVEVSGLTKTFGPVVAVDSVDLTIDNGTYFVLLGPSGGGKTTLLRLVGGFAKPTSAGCCCTGATSATCRSTSGRPRWCSSHTPCSPT